jgi:RES domain-containing protein
LHIFSGLVWRHVPRGGHALHAGWILRAAGRWNRAGVYGCLYTALIPEGALAEYRRYRTRAAATRQPDVRDLVSIRVNRIGPVFDVTEAEACAQVGVALEVLTGDEPDDVETCRTVADWARRW